MVGSANRWRTATAVSLAVALALTVAVDRCLVAQDRSETARRVEQLVRDLDANNRSQRDRAEEDLLALGPSILDYVPAPDEQGISAEQRLRLRRLLPRLWRAKLEEDVKGRPVQFPNEPAPLDALLSSLQQQSGNVVRDLREQFHQEPANPRIRVDLGRTTFWPALDRVIESAGMALYLFTEDRTVGLIGRPAIRKPVCYAGAFRLAVDRVVVQRDYAAGDTTAAAFIALEMLVEPRLKPLLVEIDTAKFTVTDDRDRPIPLAGPKSFPIVPDPKLYHLPVTLKLAAPRREAHRIKSLRGEFLVSLPAHVETFVFANLAKSRSFEQSRAGVRVRVAQLDDDGEGTWTVPLLVALPAAAPPTESHLQAALEPELFLAKVVDQTRFDQNGGFNTVTEEPNRVHTEYYFRDVPGKLEDYQLVVRVPVGVTSVPVSFAFENLELP
jgi:hypothetical protein